MTGNIYPNRNLVVAGCRHMSLTAHPADDWAQCPDLGLARLHLPSPSPSYSLVQRPSPVLPHNRILDAHASINVVVSLPVMRERTSSPRVTATPTQPAPLLLRSRPRVRALRSDGRPTICRLTCLRLRGLMLSALGVRARAADWVGGGKHTCESANGHLELFVNELDNTQPQGR